MENKKLLCLICLLITIIFYPRVVSGDQSSVNFNLQSVQRIYKNNYSWGSKDLSFTGVTAVENGYIIVGRQRNNEGIILKLNQDLEQEWDYSVVNPLKDVIQLNNKQFIAIGADFVVNFDQHGQFKWIKDYSAEINSIAKVSTDRFVIAGSKDEGAWLTEINGVGDTNWSRIFSNFGIGSINAVTKATNGDLILAGEIVTNKNWQFDSRVWVVRTTKTGVKKWMTSSSRSAAWGDRFLAVKETTEQDIMLIGDDGYLTKLSPSGAKIWAKTMPGFTVTYNDFVEVDSGGFLLLGQKSIGRMEGAGAIDYPYAVIIDSAGNLMEEKTYKKSAEGGFTSGIVEKKGGRDIYLAVGSGYQEFDLFNSSGLVVDFNQVASKKSTIFTANSFDKEIDYQEQQDRLQVDLFTIRDKVLTGVQLKEWQEYYQPNYLSPVDSAWGKQGVPVILIHGFQTQALTETDYERAIKLTFGKLVNRIAQTNSLTLNDIKIYGCTWPTKVNSLDKNGELLKEAIASNGALKNRDDLIIIAHSMGGILARSYIENHGGAKQVQRLITIATPHQGVPASLVYNWTQSKYLQAVVDNAADNPLGLDFPGLKDTFATENFYKETGFTNELVEQGSKLRANYFLQELNKKFDNYYDSGKYRLIGADIATDYNVKFIYDLINRSYKGVRNDGLVATTSSLFNKQQRGIVKKSSHTAITEDNDVLTAIINEIDDLIYSFQLEQDLLRKADKLKLEIYKRGDKHKFRIYSEIIKHSEKNNWSSADLIDKLTIQGYNRTTKVGLSGTNWVEIHAIKGNKQQKIASFSINRGRK
jgi:triacylglycerol esterase/lipase EstA (alpha/beta hydrolase family)